MEEKIIDVLFPYYGDVDLMKKAVYSVLGQTYKNWRLKVYDDGFPSDEPERFFTDLIQQENQINGFSRISYEKNATNLGANGNYRKALEKAESEYYVMMGADDMMHPDFLQRFIDALEEVGDFDIYQPGVDVIDENDKVYLPLVDRVKRKVMPKEAGLYKGEELAKNYLQGWHYFPSMIWKTESAKAVGFNTAYDVVQDVNMGLDIMQRGGSLYLDKDHVTFSYRRHSQSDSSIKALDGQRFNEEKKFYNTKYKEFKKLGWNKAAKAVKHHYFSRLNALSLVPKAMKAEKGSMKELFRHVLNIN